MPQVTVSLPQDLIDRLDRYAREHWTTRNAALRGLAERGLSRNLGHLPSRADELLHRPARSREDGAGEMRQAGAGVRVPPRRPTRSGA